MQDEIASIAGATQEVAKTAGTAIEASSKLGTFLARVLGEPIDSTVGMLADKLKFVRWERQLRFYDRWKAITDERSLQDSMKPVSPKLALPIIENACLEENDTLQDLWAHLLASATDPTFPNGVRTAFIDIIKQLEVKDAHLLRCAHSHYRNLITAESEKTHPIPADLFTSPIDCPVNDTTLQSSLSLSNNEYQIAIDNLFRLRCLTSFISNKVFDSSENGKLTKNTLSTHYNYEQICITPLGVAFVEACMPDWYANRLTQF